ncbi:hypothetical protein ABPH35_03770 [Streptococcus sp. ZJ93]|uniref:hypothetical protein n=1 Tax=Streptococcus handemini TaxID=3161188 RepID=UPI0032F07B04
MAQEPQKRLIELYEKGILTKEEARACFLEFDEELDFLVEEEKPRLSFTLPRLKIFSSSKLKQEYAFADIESLFISMSEGKVSFVKNKSNQVQIYLVYPQQTDQAFLPQIYVENQGLHFASNLPCHLTVSLPEQWMSILNLDLGRADARLDYLPFEDISIHSSTDKKQQDIRITAMNLMSQHLFLQLVQAPVYLQVPKQQGLHGKVESSTGQLVVNRKKKPSPYFCEKKGDYLLYLHIKTVNSPISVKGVQHAIRIL